LTFSTQKNALDGYLFVAANLAMTPKYGPEELNVATVVDRQVSMESTINKLASTVSSLLPDAAEVEKRLSVLNVSISDQLDKLNALSDQLTATATLMQDLSGPPQNKTSSDSDRDRSMNVVLFGIAENRDASVWRQGVLDAFITFLVGL